MEDGDREKYHVSGLIQGFVFSSRKMGCIRCISLQVYNKLQYFCNYKIMSSDYCIACYEVIII